MVRNWLLLSIVLVMIFTLSACPSATEDFSIPTVEDKGIVLEGGIIPDPGLEGVIRETLRKPTGEIFASDLEQLTMLRAGSVDMARSGGRTAETRYTTEDLASKNIADLTGLELCINLKILWLNKNQLTDISQLAYLTDLERLEIPFNQITDLSPLVSLTKLNWLRIEGNEISDISTLASLTNLKNLNLATNQISTLSPLASLSELTRLELGGNQITDISALAGLTELRELQLHNNNIIDILPLVENSGISEGDMITLANNPLNETSVAVYIPQLRDRGVEVSWSGE